MSPSIYHEKPKYRKKQGHQPFIRLSLQDLGFTARELSFRTPRASMIQFCGRPKQPRKMLGLYPQGFYEDCLEDFHIEKADEAQSTITQKEDLQTYSGGEEQPVPIFSRLLRGVPFTSSCIECIGTMNTAVISVGIDDCDDKTAQGKLQKNDNLLMLYITVLLLFYKTNCL